jgi:hypothetical protein
VVLPHNQHGVPVHVVRFRVLIHGCRGVRVLLRACTGHVNVILEFGEILVVVAQAVPLARKLSDVAMEGIMLLNIRVIPYIHA